MRAAVFVAVLGLLTSCGREEAVQEWRVQRLQKLDRLRLECEMGPDTLIVSVLQTWVSGDEEEQEARYGCYMILRSEIKEMNVSFWSGTATVTEFTYVKRLKHGDRS